MENRRELASRKIGLFQTLAKVMIKIGLTPNSVSVLSVVFAFVGGYGFYLLSQADFALGWTLAVLGIQLRLLCNMIDGLMAVEGGMKSPMGEVFNDLPDRISDVALILGASFVIQTEWGRELGWLAAVLAILTAYVRVLGNSMGQKKADFSGPMAKQHRMAVLNLTLIAVLVGHLLQYEFSSQAFLLGLTVIAVGSFVTCCRRLLRLSRNMR